MAIIYHDIEVMNNSSVKSIGNIYICFHAVHSYTQYVPHGL